MNRVYENLVTSAVANGRTRQQIWDEYFNPDDPLSDAYCKKLMEIYDRLYPSTLPPLINLPEPLNLFPYQLEAVAAAQDEFRAQGKDRCYIQLPTGAGKTRVMYQLINDDYAEFRSQSRANQCAVYLCLSPRIDLARQHFSPENLKFLAYDNKLLAADIIELHSKSPDIKIREILAGWLPNRATRPLIITGLYQSLPRIMLFLAKQSELGNIPSVRMVFPDEAHMIAGWCQDQVLTTDAAVRDFMLSTITQQMVFLSATPTNNQSINQNNKWGRIIKTVSVAELIQLGRLVPIETLIPNIRVISNTRADGTVQHRLDNESFCQVLLASIRYKRARKMVVFCNTQENASKLKQIFNRQSAAANAGIQAFEYIGSGKSGDTPSITDLLSGRETATGLETEEDLDTEDNNLDPLKLEVEFEKRGDIVLFENCPGPAVVFACKKISMGYDFPPIDFVAFADPKCSKTELAQCIGRGLRATKGKNVCWVFIPITPDDYRYDTSLKRRHQTLFQYLGYLRDEVNFKYDIPDSRAANSVLGPSSSLPGDGQVVSFGSVPNSELRMVLGSGNGSESTTPHKTTISFIDREQICLMLSRESVLGRDCSDAEWLKHCRREYEFYKAKNRERGFRTAEEYTELTIAEYEHKLEPVAEIPWRFSGVWENWSEFLGIKTTGYPQSIPEWTQLCRRIGVSSFDDYYEKVKHHPELPHDPDDFYRGFIGIDYYLGF